MDKVKILAATNILLEQIEKLPRAEDRVLATGMLIEILKEVNKAEPAENQYAK